MGQGDLPIAGAMAHARAFERAGFTILPRRGRGTHILLSRPGNRMVISLPNHKDVKRGLLAQQIKNAGLTIEQYVELFGAK